MSVFLKENLIFIVSLIAVAGLVGVIQNIPAPAPTLTGQVSAVVPQSSTTTATADVAQATSSPSVQADMRVQPLKNATSLRGDNERFDD